MQGLIPNRLFRPEVDLVSVRIQQNIPAPSRDQPEHEDNAQQDDGNHAERPPLERAESTGDGEIFDAFFSMFIFLVDLNTYFRTLLIYVSA